MYAVDLTKVSENYVEISGSYTLYYLYRNGLGYYNNSSNAYSVPIGKFNETTNTFSWYLSLGPNANVSANAQLNDDTYIYYYIAIG